MRYPANTTYRYLGRKPRTADHPAVNSGLPSCRAQARGAVGDCTRVEGHDGFHQNVSTCDAWVDEPNDNDEPAPVPAERLAQVAADLADRLWERFDLDVEDLAPELDLDERGPGSDYDRLLVEFVSRLSDPDTLRFAADLAARATHELG